MGNMQQTSRYDMGTFNDRRHHLHEFIDNKEEPNPDSNKWTQRSDQKKDSIHSAGSASGDTRERTDSHDSTHHREKTHSVISAPDYAEHPEKYTPGIIQNQIGALPKTYKMN